MALMTLLVELMTLLVELMTLLVELMTLLVELMIRLVFTLIMVSTLRWFNPMTNLVKINYTGSLQ